MAEKEQFIVVHPVRHNTKYHARGTSIRLSTVAPKDKTESEADRLLRLKSVRRPDVLVEADPDPIVLGAPTLAKLNLAELNAYAVSHGYTLDEGLTKEAILLALATPPAIPVDKQREVGSEIQQDAQRNVDTAEAEEAAAREGR